MSEQHSSIRVPQTTLKPNWIDFVIGGTATVWAVVFTNPLEVVKTRLQLQGELIARDSTQPRIYKNVFHGFYLILKTEGIRGIQKGLFTAACYQATMNGIRLGSYPYFKSFLQSSSGDHSFGRNVAAGALAGLFGAMVGSPWYLVKTRLQAQSEHTQHAVGHQHRYANSFQAFKHIWKYEGGFKALYRGVEGSALRVVVGSSVQLATYDQFKLWLIRSGLVNDNIFAHIGSSLVTGLIVATAMNPFDVVATRLYNQKVENGVGVLYSGPIDCFAKTLTSEGFRGLFKGWTAHYFRLGPHVILTFVFLEQLKILTAKFRTHK